MIVIGFFTGWYVVRKNTRLERLNYEFDEFDLRWTPLLAGKFSVISCLAGVCTGLLGAGAGIIVGPVMLYFKIRPEISAANSSVIIIITSSISCILFFNADLMVLDYAAWFLSFSMLGSGIGLLIIRKIVEKKKRVSILVILLGSVLMLSALMIPAYGVWNSIEMDKKGKFKLEFSEFCP